MKIILNLGKLHIIFCNITLFTGNVWKSPSQFYPAGIIWINPPGKSQKNPHEGGFFQKTVKNWPKMVTFV